jgi:hypothetical protein
MIDYQKYIGELRKCAKEHENDKTLTGHIIVSDLCRDTADLLEFLEREYALKESKGMVSTDVDHPEYYNDGKIEVIDFIEDKKLGFCLGNAVKYISRAGKKDKSKEIEDLKKASWYTLRRIKEIKESEG